MSEITLNPVPRARNPLAPGTKGSGIIHCFVHKSWRSGITAHVQEVNKLINIISTLLRLVTSKTIEMKESNGGCQSPSFLDREDRGLWVRVWDYSKGGVAGTFLNGKYVSRD